MVDLVEKSKATLLTVQLWDYKFFQYFVTHGLTSSVRGWLITKRNFFTFKYTKKQKPRIYGFKFLNFEVRSSAVFFLPKITATLLTEEFSFQLCVYLFLKQKDIMLRRDTAKTYGAHFKYYWFLVSDRKFNWDFL